MIKFFRKQMNKKGFTLIELIVVIAILGILAAIAVPRLTGFSDSAQDQVNESNAKLLTNIAQLIEADTGSYPAWSATFASLSVADATVGGKAYLQEAIAVEGTGNFSYDATTGVVTAP